jgi:hypothetical protein
MTGHVTDLTPSSRNQLFAVTDPTQEDAEDAK